LGIIKESGDPKRIYQGVSAKLAKHFPKLTYIIIIDEVLSKVVVLPFGLISKIYERLSGYGKYRHLTFTIERKNNRYMVKGGDYIPDKYVDNIPNTEKIFEVLFDLKEAHDECSKS